MKFTKVTIVYLLLIYLQMGYAQERTFKNGWTSIMHEDFVDYCTGSAVNKNMKYLVEKKVFTVGSEPYKRILNKVKQHQISVCECTHNIIMKVYTSNEITRMMKERANLIQIAKNCSEQILSRTKK